MNIIQPQYTWANELAKRTNTNYIVLHHTAGSGMSAEAIHQSHLANGWAGIGYHFYVRKDGTVYRGRPIEVAGAHCVNFNSQSVGISAEGNFETEAMNDTQKAAIAEVLRHVLSLYPKAVVVRHRDMNQTACPGANYPFDAIVTLATNAVIIIAGGQMFPGKLIDGVTYAPVRKVAEAVGKTVEWNGTTRTVIIK